MFNTIEYLTLVAILMIVGSIVWLIGTYYDRIRCSIPCKHIELSLYIGLTVAIFISPYIFDHSIYHIWAILFALGLTTTTVFSAKLSGTGSIMTFNLVNMIIHGVAGAYIGSYLLTVLSSMFLMALIGFNPGFTSFELMGRYLIMSTTDYYFLNDATKSYEGSTRVSNPSDGVVDIIFKMAVIIYQEAAIKEREKWAWISLISGIILYNL